MKVNGPPDPSKVRVSGPGIHNGVLRQYNGSFTVNTQGAGAGELTVKVRGPKGLCSRLFSAEFLFYFYFITLTIHKMFTKMIPSVNHLPYETRLRKLTLEGRRIRADLIKVFKIIHGLSSVNFSTFFEYSTRNRTRGHSLKLNKKRSRLDLRQHFFSERVQHLEQS